MQLFSILIITQILSAQGLQLDAPISSDRKGFERSRADAVPRIASLKAYTPIPLLQRNSTCVAHSLAAARTIVYARNHDLTNQSDITSHYYSPHWIYFINKDDNDTFCEMGLSLDKAVGNMMEVGVPRMAFVEYPEFYPFTDATLCNYYPPKPDEDAQDAFKWKIDEVYILENLEDVKIALSAGLPIVFGMAVPESFESAIDQDLWIPTTSDKTLEKYGHAMVIIGYNDYKYGGAVEIMNSWGSTWGKEGYIWIRYDDLLDYITQYVYAINSKKEERFGSTPNFDKKLDEKLQMDLKQSELDSARQDRSFDALRLINMGFKEVLLDGSDLKINQKPIHKN